MKDANAKNKKEQITFSNKRRDIIVLCETKCTLKTWIEGTSRDAKYFANGYDAYVSENGFRGLIVLIKKGSNLNVKKFQILNPDIIRPDIERGLDSITVFGVYGTSRYDDAQFFINLRTHMLDIGNKDVTILGDLNLSLNKTKDLEGNITDPHWRSRAVVNEWLESGDYTDAYRSLNPEGTRKTWMHPDTTKSGRLDYILISNSLAGKLKYCKITNCPKGISDHQGVEACIIMDSSPTGPGTFRAAPLL